MNWPPEEVEPAPAALLERILASRAAGERRILPSDHAPRSRLRVGLLRGVIAAVLGLVAAGIWAKWDRRSPNVPKATSSVGFNFPIGGDFGFGEYAFAQGAQGTQEPKFAPMVFDTTRLHPMRLRYAISGFEDGKQTDTDSGRTYSLSRAVSGEWVVTADRLIHDSTSAIDMELARTLDTLWMDKNDLHDLKESIVSHVTWVKGSAWFGGRRARVDVEFHTNSARLITADTGWQPASVATSKAAPGADSATTPNKSSGRSKAPTAQQNQSAAPAPRMDTTVRIAEMTLPLPKGRYPRLNSLYSGGAELVVKLMAAPIEAGWKRSVVIPRPGGATARENVKSASIPVDLEVVGEAPCGAPSGKTVCWKIVRHNTTFESTMLLRKNDGVMVWQRIEAVDSGKKFAVETTLIEEK